MGLDDGGGLVAKSCLTLETPWILARQAPLSSFSRQDYWSGLPFPSPGDLPDPGIKSLSPALQANSSPTEPPVFKYLLPFTRVGDYIWVGQMFSLVCLKKPKQTFWPIQYSSPIHWDSDQGQSHSLSPFPSPSLCPHQRGCSVTLAHLEHGMQQ